MNLYSLCASGFTAYLPDIAVGIFALVMVFVSARRGFIGCVLGIVSSLVAVILAISLAGAVVDGTGGFFGLQGSFQATFEKSFAKTDGFNVDISQVGLETALKTQDVSAILSRLALKAFGGEELAAGTTLAMLLGEATASLAVRLIAGILLFIVIKIVVRLLRRILSGIVDNIPLLGGVNRLLGGAFGLVYAWVIVSAILAVLAVIPSLEVAAFLENTLFVGLLYERNIVVIALSWFL